MIKVEESNLDVALAGFEQFTQKQSKVRVVNVILQCVPC